MTSGFELRPKIIPIKEGETVDDICSKIVALAALPVSIESITITKSVVKAEIWHPVGDDPLSSDIPDEDARTISDVLHRVTTLEVLPEKPKINVGALAVMADLLIRARMLVPPVAGVAWVVGSAERFKEWLNLSAIPVRLLEMPLIEYTDIPEDRLVLLCGKSSRHHVLQAVMAMTTSMVRED